MNKLRRPITALLLWSIIFIPYAWTQNTLTQIRDIVYNADGSPFNGTVIITWNGFTPPSGGTIAPRSTSAQIYNGALSILLLPSASTGSNSYMAAYNSNDGLTTFTETWKVPSSLTPLTLSQVRQTGGSTTPTGTGTPTGGTTSGGTPTSTITLPLPMTQVAGLSAALANINSSINTLSTTVRNLPSPSVSGVVFIDGEVPSGAINGVNTTFTLAQSPTPVSSLHLYLNGLEQTPGVDFTTTGSTVAFSSRAIPQAGDLMNAYYRTPGTGTTAQFVDGEIPAGTVDGTNSTFTLAAAPTPAASLRLYKNGMLLQLGTDYTLNNAAIAFVAAAVPQPGDVLAAWYRH